MAPGSDGEGAGTQRAAGSVGASAPSDQGGPAGDDEVVDVGAPDVEVVDVEPVGADGGPGEGGTAEGDTAEADPLTVALVQRDEYLDSLRRLQADFENYKKRVNNQQSDQLARAAASLVDKLLPVLDTLDLASQHLGDAESTDAKALVAAGGLLHGVLAKEGLERIDPMGQVFDPNAHEAVGHLPAEEASAAGEAGEGDPPAPGGPVVAQVLRPGYRWKGIVVRPAMVTVQG